MVVFSKIAELANWVFNPSPSDPKHLTLLHPLLTALIGNATTWFLSSKLSDAIYKKWPSTKAPLPGYAKKYILPFMIIYWIALASIRFLEQGPYAFYELLWGCNLGIVMFINGLSRDNVIPIASTILLIGVDQSLWYVDILGWLATGKFPIGVAKYITWPETTVKRLITTTHHLWFLPLVVSACKNMKSYPKIIYLFTYLLSLPMTIIPRLMTPKTLNIPGNLTSDGKPEEVYMNIMLTYELWKDVKSGLFSFFDKSHPAVTAAFSNQGWNACNIIIFIVCHFLFPYFAKKGVSTLKKVQ